MTNAMNYTAPPAPGTPQINGAVRQPAAEAQLEVNKAPKSRPMYTPDAETAAEKRRQGGL